MSLWEEVAEAGGVLPFSPTSPSYQRDGLHLIEDLMAFDTLYVFELSPETPIYLFIYLFIHFISMFDSSYFCII